MKYHADRFKVVILEAAWFLFTIAILALMVTLVEAGEYEEGLAAVKEEDYQTAFAKWKPLAVKGNSDAQFGLGYMYLQGQGVVLNYKKAMRWFRMAAEQGDPDAQNNLGLMYAVGTGVLEDPIYALMWFELAAANGSEGAKKNIIASEKTLSQSELSVARKLAAKCTKKKNKDC